MPVLLPPRDQSESRKTRAGVLLPPKGQKLRSTHGVLLPGQKREISQQAPEFNQFTQEALTKKEQPLSKPVVPQSSPIPPGVTERGVDMFEQVKTALTGAVKDTLSRFQKTTPQEVAGGNVVKAFLKPEEEKQIVDFVSNLARKVVDGKPRQHKNKPQGAELVKDYVEGQVTGRFAEGKENLNKPEVENKVAGTLQIAQSLFSATPHGAAWNTALGIGVGTATAVKNKKPLDSSIRKAIVNPDASAAYDVFGIENPALAFVVDMALMRNPKSIVKDPTGLKDLANTLKKAKGTPGKADFRMAELDQYALDEAYSMVRDPEKYLQSTKIDKTTRQAATQAVRDDAVITLNKLAQHYLPDDELKKLGFDKRFITSDEVVNYDVDWQKVAVRIGELNQKNKLAMVTDEAPFDIPKMGITGKSQAKSGIIDELPNQMKNTDPIIQEASKYKDADEFWLRMPRAIRNALREQGIKSSEQIKNWFNKNATPKEATLDTLNPTGGLHVDYDPKSRMTMPLGKNITTYDKTANLKPDDIVTVYRGTSGGKINPGDFITTNYNLAKSYSGKGKVAELKVKASDILDDVTEPLGEEYIYRPKAAQPPLSDAPVGMGNVDVSTLPKTTATGVRRYLVDSQVKKSPSAAKITGEAPQARVTRTTQERTLLKEKLRVEAKGARVGAREGEKIGKARAENIAEVKQDKAVRAEQLKALREGIKTRIASFSKGTIEGKKVGRQEVATFQKDLTTLLQELPITERGKLTYLAGLRKANTPEKMAKEAQKINAAITKVAEAEALSKTLGKRRSNIAFINKISEFNATVVRDVKKQLNLRKPTKDMNEQELNQLNAALLGRLKFKEERGFKVKGSTPDDLERVPAENVYESNRQVMAENKKIGNRFSKGVKDAVKAPKETLDNLFGAISTRLKNIDPSLKRQMRTFEFKVAKAKQADRKSVEPFVKKIKSKNMDANDYADLDLALKNGDSAKINTILKKYGLEEDFANVRQTLDDLYKRADEMGFDIGYRKNYTPRVITDPEGFLEYIQKGDDWSIIDEAIKAKEHELARYLTTEEKANLINTMVRGYKGGQITLTETGAMKLRSIEVVDDKINQFYGDSVDSLLKYIDKTNDAIEARRFFGKVKDAELTRIDDSIGKYILDLLAAGKIKASQEKELRDILTARFNPVGTHGMWGTYKNLAYIDTMGSPISAITQIGDLAFAVYKGGPINAAKALGRAVFGKSQITRKDIGIEKIATEFEDGSMTATLVDKVFKAVGLTKMDTLGKETVINATISKYRNLAKKPDQDFIDKLTTVYGNDEAAIARVIDDLKAGNITEDVKLLAFNELLDVQPVALSEMPVQYLKGGNGRVFYMLKTYTVKLFDVYRNEVWHEMVKNPAKGMKNLIYLTGTLALANATADEIKDVVLGRETSLEDRTVDNLLKLAGFSKFTVYKARQEGAGSAISQSILPPMKLLDSITKDLTPKDDRELKDLEVYASVPVGGKLYYWWFGKGAKKSEDKREKETKKEKKGSLRDRYGGAKKTRKKKSLRDKYLN